MAILETYRGGAPFIALDNKVGARFYLSASDFAKLPSLDQTRVDLQTIQSAIDAESVNLDFVISDIGFNYADRSQITPHMGDSMSAFFFGKQVLVLNVKGRLFETTGGDSRHVLFTLYRDLFRLSSVAKHKISPILEFVDCHVQGAFLDLEVSDSVAVEDGVEVSFSYLAFNFFQYNPENELGLDPINIWYDQKSADGGNQYQIPEYIPKLTASGPIEVDPDAPDVSYASSPDKTLVAETKLITPAVSQEETSTIFADPPIASTSPPGENLTASTPETAPVSLSARRVATADPALTAITKPTTPTPKEVAAAQAEVAIAEQAVANATSPANLAAAEAKLKVASANLNTVTLTSLAALAAAEAAAAAAAKAAEVPSALEKTNAWLTSKVNALQAVSASLQAKSDAIAASVNDVLKGQLGSIPSLEDVTAFLGMTGKSPKVFGTFSAMTLVGMLKSGKLSASLGSSADSFVREELAAISKASGLGFSTSTINKIIKNASPLDLISPELQASLGLNGAPGQKLLKMAEDKIESISGVEEFRALSRLTGEGQRRLESYQAQAQGFADDVLGDGMKKIGISDRKVDAVLKSERLLKKVAGTVEGDVTTERLMSTALSAADPDRFGGIVPDTARSINSITKYL